MKGYSRLNPHNRFDQFYLSFLSYVLGVALLYPSSTSNFHLFSALRRLEMSWLVYRPRTHSRISPPRKGPSRWARSRSAAKKTILCTITHRSSPRRRPSGPEPRTIRASAESTARRFISWSVYAYAEPTVAHHTSIYYTPQQQYVHPRIYVNHSTPYDHRLVNVLDRPQHEGRHNNAQLNEPPQLTVQWSAIERNEEN
jgi:hypothetical protein